MADSFSVEHRVNRRYQDGLICGCDTEIVVTLPPRSYRRLTHALGWHSVHWPGKRRRRAAKSKKIPAEPSRPRGRPRKLKPMLVESAPPVTCAEPLQLPVVEAETSEDFLPTPVQTPGALARNRLNRKLVKRLARRQQRKREHNVKPDIAYVLKTLREMLFIAERKEAYHAVALRAVQGPRVRQRLRALSILPLLRRECIRPLRMAISRLEMKQ